MTQGIAPFVDQSTRKHGNVETIVTPHPANDGVTAVRSRGLERAVLAASLGTFSLGYNTAIAAGAMLYIKEDPIFAPLSGFDCGLLVSSTLAGATFGAGLGGVADRIGRRWTLLTMAMVNVAGTLAMSIAPNFASLLLGRLVTGLGVGVASGLVNLYISEIAPSSERGRLGGWAPFCGTLGVLISYVVSTVLGIFASGAWRLQLGMGAIPALLQLALHAWQPETPRWFVAQGRLEEARQSLRRLNDEATEQDLSEDLQRLEDELDHQSNTQQVGLVSLLRLHGKSAFLGVALNVLQQVSGINIVIYYGSTVLVLAGFSANSSMLALVAMTVLQLLMTGVLVSLVDRVGRRPLALWGLVVMAFGLSCLVAAFLGEGTLWAPAIAVFGMLVFRGAFSLSLGPLPYIMTAEFFPQEARAAGVALSWTSNWASNFCVSMLFPLSQDWLKQDLGPSRAVAAIFSSYIAFCFVALSFCYWMLPETRGAQLGKCCDPAREQLLEK